MTSAPTMLVPGTLWGPLTGFYHFLTGYLLPIALWLEGREGERIVVADCGPLNPWFDVLVPRDAVRFLPPGEMLREVARGAEGAVVLRNLDDPFLYVPEELQRFRTIVVGRLGLPDVGHPGHPPALPDGRVLMLDRTFVDPYYLEDRFKASRFPGTGPTRRTIPNIDRVEAAIARDAEVVREDLAAASPAEQVTRVAGSRVLVAQHGAGLTNMFWLPPGSSVLEILPPMHARLNASNYAMLARDLGHTYAVVHQDDLHAPVDPERIASEVRRIRQPGARTSPARPHPVTMRQDRAKRRARRLRRTRESLRRVVTAPVRALRALVRRGPRDRSAVTAPEPWVAVPEADPAESGRFSAFLWRELGPLALALDGAEPTVVTVRSCLPYDDWLDLVAGVHRLKVLDVETVLLRFGTRRSALRLLAAVAPDGPDAPATLQRLRRILITAAGAAEGRRASSLTVVGSDDEEGLRVALEGRAEFAGTHVARVDPASTPPAEVVATLAASRVLVVAPGADADVMLLLPAGATVLVGPSAAPAAALARTLGLELAVVAAPEGRLDLDAVAALAASALAVDGSRA